MTTGNWTVQACRAPGFAYELYRDGRLICAFVERKDAEAYIREQERKDQNEKERRRLEGG